MGNRDGREDADDRTTIINSIKGEAALHALYLTLIMTTSPGGNRPVPMGNCPSSCSEKPS